LIWQCGLQFEQENRADCCLVAKRFVDFLKNRFGIATAKTAYATSTGSEQHMSKLNETFIETLKDTYDAEHQILKALPKVIKQVEDDELRSALESHLEETQEHAKRLEQVFEIFGESPKRKKCNGMAGLITEGDEVIQEEQGEAALILALQKVEHYEIAAYGALVSWAKLLGQEKAAELLSDTLEEENAADEKLNDIAEETVNSEEAGGESEQRKAA
jgi:ferritin-like metal-binding protein YciE